MITTIKLKTKLDITDKRTIQNGLLRPCKNRNNEIYARVSTLPCIQGEKIAIRIHFGEKKLKKLKSLGLNKKQLHDLQKLLACPSGLLLFTGPTGSGKTTTILSIIKYLKDKNLNIFVIEDPTEVILNNVNQINISEKAKLNYSKTFRAILRQDPDVIVFSEIRDASTAKLIIEVAQSGVLAISSMHAKNNYFAIKKLLNWDILFEDLLEVLKITSSQRLIRILCKHKKNQTRQKTKCKVYNSNYKGRRAIYDFCLEEDIIEFKENNKLFYEKQKKSLLKVALKLGIQKITNLNEIKRIFQIN